MILTLLRGKQPHFSGEETDLERSSHMFSICLPVWHQFIYLIQQGWDPKPTCTPQTQWSCPHSLLPGKLDSSPPFLMTYSHHLHTSLHILLTLWNVSLTVSSSQDPLYHTVSTTSFLITLGVSDLPSPNPRAWTLATHCLSPPALCHHYSCQVLSSLLDCKLFEPNIFVALK